MKQNVYERTVLYKEIWTQAVTAVAKSYGVYVGTGIEEVLYRDNG